MKKFTIIFFLALSISSFAQDDGFYGSNEPTTKNSKKELRQKNLERWSFGGNFWVSFGSNAYVELSPILLYKLTPKLLVGPGFTFIYIKDNYYNYESSIYGPRAIATYTLLSNLKEKININIGNIILHTEFEYLSTDEVDNSGFLTNQRVWVSNLLLGGGIYQPIGPRGGISLMILYNFFENNNSAYNYSNPVFRFGFYF